METVTPFQHPVDEPEKGRKERGAGPVTVFRSTEEAVYAPLVASMNAAGIRAKALDTAQAGLRWDVQVIAPVEVWVPATDAPEAHEFIENWFAEQPGGALAHGWISPDHAADTGGLARRLGWAIIILAVCLMVAGYAAMTNTTP